MQSRRDTSGEPHMPAHSGGAALFVFAHPDDESFIAGGTIRLEADRGKRVVLIVATGGEEGEVVNPELQGTIDLHDLPAMRQQELACSVASLGVSEVIHLGYRDSGMADSESSRLPSAFSNADIDDVAGAVVRVIRVVRPQVMVTFDENGGYGHPDHIKINRATHLAYERAGDPAWYPDTGSPWQPLKLYYVVVPSELIQRAEAAFAERGIPFTLGVGLPPEDLPPGFPAERVTTVIDIGSTVFHKRESLRCYRTQMRPDFFALAAPDDVLATGLDREYFSLVRSTVQTPTPESDLFAAIAPYDTSP
ncbi:MAG: mycothiol conjugate amidase Mca [Chloroflexota bacterium]